MMAEFGSHASYHFVMSCNSDIKIDPSANEAIISGNVISVPTLQKLKVPKQFADESYKLLSQIQVNDPTPEEAGRIRNKCVKWILPFICIGYHIMYVDKKTVSRRSAER
jgi:hypothetical protein